MGSTGWRVGSPGDAIEEVGAGSVVIACGDGDGVVWAGVVRVGRAQRVGKAEVVEEARMEVMVEASVAVRVVIGWRGW